MIYFEQINVSDQMQTWETSHVQYMKSHLAVPKVKLQIETFTPEHNRRLHLHYISVFLHLWSTLKIKFELR